MTATIACKHCEAPIPARSISDGELAICEFCAALNNLSDEPIPLPQKDKAKRTSWIPEKLTYQQHDDGVEIKYRWFAKQHWMSLFISLFWNSIMALVIGSSIAEGDLSPLLCTSLHISIGVIIGYYTLVGFTNHTRLMIRERGIEIKSRPLPAYNHPDRHIDRRAIEQVYVTRRYAGTVRDKPYYEFDVHYNVKGRADAILVRGVRSHEEALFIEQQVERLYQIENEEIEGEWTGTEARNFDDDSQQQQKKKK